MIRFALIASLLATACSDDPLSYSAPVAINLKAKSSDTRNAVVTDEKAITTENGNPYGAFVSDAQDALDGRDPAMIDVDRVELFLGASSTGVTSLGEVFNGDVDVLFQMNDTNNTYPVAGRSVDASTGPGPVAFDIEFSTDVPDADFEKLMSGSFKVVVRGAAASDFETKGADADLQTTFTFAAYE